jgi:hypothetical protein
MHRPGALARDLLRTPTQRWGFFATVDLAEAKADMSSTSVDVFGRHVSRRWCLSSEQPIAIEASKKIPVMPLVDLARDRLEMAGRSSAL